MTDYTWSDCDFAMAGFSKILNNKEEVYKPNIVHGKTHMYKLISYCGNINAIVTFSMFLLSNHYLYHKSNSFLGLISFYPCGYFLYSTFWYFTKGITISIVSLINETNDSKHYIKDKEELLKIYYEYIRSKVILTTIPSFLWIMTSTKFIYGLFILLSFNLGIFHAYRTFPKIDNYTATDFKDSEDIENKRTV
tara:strand:- start:5657 stop:6235 length:579 start_codon:yes stop_codon:yes gene_type:complete